MAKRKPKSPAEQAASPINGQVPPADKRFQAGRSGNPLGRPKNAGSSVLEHVNALAAHTETQLRAIARNPKLPWSRRTAARRMLGAIESGDLADFAGLLRGENNLEDLRAMGINTEVVKKFKQKTRVVPAGDGETEEVIDREIEFHDRGGADFDRLLDRTIGKPAQVLPVDDNGNAISFVFAVAQPPAKP